MEEGRYNLIEKIIAGESTIFEDLLYCRNLCTHFAEQTFGKKAWSYQVFNEWCSLCCLCFYVVSLDS